MLAAIGVDYEEIGRLLGISVNTVKIRVHRARLKLTAAATESPGSPHEDDRRRDERLAHAVPCG